MFAVSVALVLLASAGLVSSQSPSLSGWTRVGKAFPDGSMHNGNCSLQDHGCSFGTNGGNTDWWIPFPSPFYNGASYEILFITANRNVWARGNYGALLSIVDAAAGVTAPNFQWIDAGRNGYSVGSITGNVFMRPNAASQGLPWVTLQGDFCAHSCYEMLWGENGFSGSNEVSLLMNNGGIEVYVRPADAWTPVGRMAPDGSLFNGRCQLQLTGCSFGTAGSTDSDWWAPYSGQADQILFVTGNRKYWAKGNYASLIAVVNAVGSDFAPNVPWIDAGRNGVSIGAATGNILMRPSFAEDPFLTLQGTHCADGCAEILWGENGYVNIHTALASQNGGVEVYALTLPPPTPAPVPFDDNCGTGCIVGVIIGVALLLLGSVLFVYFRRQATHHHAPNAV